MTTQIAAETGRDDLAAEMQRYLAAVEAFRAEGHEPRWLADSRDRNDDLKRPLHERKPCTRRRTA